MQVGDCAFTGGGDVGTGAGDDGCGSTRASGTAAAPEITLRCLGFVIFDSHDTPWGRTRMPSPPGGAKLTSPWVSAPSPASYKTIEPGLRFHSVSLRPRMYWETIRIRACGTRTQRHTPYSSPYHRHTQLTRYTLHPSSTPGSCLQTAACTCGRSQRQKRSGTACGSRLWPVLSGMGPR